MTSMLLSRNKYLWKLSYLFRKYKRFIFFTIILITATNLFLFTIDQSPNFKYDEVYKGTFRGKYLETIKNANELKTDNFYTKWSLIGYLDDLVNEPIQDSTFQNSIDPFSILNDIESNDKSFSFNQLPFMEKISFYTNTILPNSNFTFMAIQDKIYKDAYYSKKFISTRLKKWLKIKEHLSIKEQEQLEIDDDWFKQVINNLRDLKLEHNLISANEIKNSLTHLKFFSNFFLNDKYKIIQEQEKEIEQNQEYLNMCSTISKKLFPWLTGDVPIFKTYDKKLNEKIINPYIDADPILANKCFVKMLQSNLKGRGIVFTLNDDLVPELASILSILRITSNTYPIQIFHNNDLSLESIKLINDIANDPIMKLPKSIPEFKLPKNPPILDITFVDVSNTITFNYKKYFSHWGMKLLAYYFNTFEEMIMLDTDTVIVNSIESFFQSPKYTSNHAYFFKDRDANSFLYEGIVDYFKSYLNYDNEVHYLELPRVKDETLNNRFFGGMARHFMESGLFLINKKEKFDGVLTSVVLQMFKLFSGSLHGEKEFIWLGQEIMGQSYSFNSHAAIAVGELSPDKGLISHELCSTHPAHINDEKSLLWFNSGFLNCKKPESYYKDINFERNEGMTLIELKKKYLSPLHITNGLIPPPAEFSINMKNGEPTRGWSMTSECSNYLWCSYDIIGGGKNINIPVGEIINFSKTDTSKWDYLGRLWVNYFNIGKLGSSDHGYIEGDAYDELGLDDIDVFKTKNGKENDDYDDEDVDISLLDEKYKTNSKDQNYAASYGASDIDDDDDEIDVEDDNSKGSKSDLKNADKIGSFFEKENKGKSTELRNQNKALIEEEDDDILSVVDEETGISKDFKEDFGGKYF
ncbi:hypothetical protein C6P42_000152 [Pichia californica]|nr:hypothetical protein C6P42_000152 [[Candida] californica]